MKPSADIYAAYYLKLAALLPLYQRLNEASEYPDGMRTSNGIIYLGRTEHYPALGDSIPGIQKFIGG